MPDYGDIYGGLPPDWQPDPNWVPPPHWGYGAEVAPPITPAPELELAQVQPGLGVPAAAVDAAIPDGLDLAQPVDTTLSPPPIAPQLAPVPPVPPPMPDAITGADLAQPPPIALEPEKLDLGAMPVTLADQWQRDPFHDPRDAERNAAVDAIALRDPMRLEQADIDLQAAKRAAGAAAAINAETENLRQAKANHEAFKSAAATAQAKTDQIVADAMELANRKIDPDRLMSNMSGGQTVAQALAVAMGGLVSGRTGGPNLGMDLLQKRIDRDIDAQKTDIENGKWGIGVRRSAVAEEYQRHGDLYRAAETVRGAAYQAALNIMLAQQQDFDPRGTQSIERGRRMQAWVRSMAAADEARRKTIFDESYRVEQLRQQATIQAETRRHNRASEGLQYQALQSAKEDRKAARDARADEKAAERADKEAERSRQFSLSAPRPVLLLDENKKPVIGADGKPVTTTQKFVNADGKEWWLADPEDRRAVKAKIVAASEIADMIDAVLDIREKVGGEIMPWSDAKQRLNLLQERMRLVRKSGTQGMSSDKDFEALGASIGAKNLTSFIDQSPGLKEARERTISELNAEMRGANYSGPAVDFANKYVGATNTPEDERRKALVTAPSASLDDTLRQNIDKAVADRGYGIDINDPADQALYQRIRGETEKSFDPRASAQQQADLADYGRAAAAGDANALAVLKEVAAKAENGRLRELAKAQIDMIEASKRPAPRGPTSTAVLVPDELRLDGGP